MPLNSPTPDRPAPARGADLKTALLIRIALVALGCFALVTAVTLIGIRGQEETRAAATADIIGRQLDMQLVRIATGIDTPKRYPDWDAVIGNLPLAGQCIALRGQGGDTVRSHCVGTLSSADGAPQWFAVALRAIFAADVSAERPVSYNGVRSGTVFVTSDASAVIDRAWHAMQLLLTLTGLTILAVSALVYAAIASALAPTREVIAGLDKLKAGDFSVRLPNFKLRELQRISEVSNALAEKIETTLAERAELSTRLINAQEDERRHLARELHDELGQNLAAIAALAASIERSGDPGVAGEARTLGKIAAGMLKSLRGTLMHLKPAEVERFGLGEGLKQLVDVWNASQRATTRFELDMPRRVGTLSASTATHIFRIAQEGLTNAARHAEASKVRLSLLPVALGQANKPDAAGIRLTIEDNGKGHWPPEGDAGNGMGLVNMQERVAALGGTIAFEDRPGGGLRVRILVPVSAAEAPHG